MKNLSYLFVAFILVVSCSKSDETTEEAFSPDPTIIAEYHLLNSGGNTHTKYIFDETGRFTTFIKVDDTMVSFEYDENGRVTNVINTDLTGNSSESFPLAYDSEGNVSSFGNRTFTYYPDDNYFIEDSSYHVEEFFSGNTETYYKKFDMDDSSYCGYAEYHEMNSTSNTLELTWEGCEGLNSSSINYMVNVDFYSSSGYYQSYRYDENANPLYSSNSNLVELLILFASRHESYGLGYHGIQWLFVIVSQNNLDGSGESCVQANPCGPEGRHYTYEFNELGLPTNATSQYYYVGSPEGDPSISARYYYQGDVIPE